MLLSKSIELRSDPARPLRFAVIGAGRQGGRHLASLARVPQQDLQVCAVVDVDSRCAEQARASNAAFYSNASMLPDDIDACIVATPTATHFDVANAVLDRGMDVLIEKPVASAFAQTQALVRLAEQRRCIFQVGYLERHHPAFSINRPDFSAPAQITARRSTMGQSITTLVDLVLELMIHDLDMVATWLGDEPSDLIWRHMRASGTEVAGLLELRFDDGHRARLYAESGAARAVRRTIVRGGSETWEFRWGSSAQPNWTAPSDASGDAATSNPLCRQLRSFVHAIRTRTPPLADGYAALRAMRLAERAIAALDSRA